MGIDGVPMVRYRGHMATTRRAPKPPAPIPLREVVASNIRAIIARDQIKVADLALKLDRPRQWVHRRSFAAGPITTEDIDAFAAALGVTSDELTRRPS